MNRIITYLFYDGTIHYSVFSKGQKNEILTKSWKSSVVLVDLLLYDDDHHRVSGV